MGGKKRTIITQERERKKECIPLYLFRARSAGIEKGVASLVAAEVLRGEEISSLFFSEELGKGRSPSEAGECGEETRLV